MSSEEVRMTSSTGGQKGGKPERHDLIPTGPLRMLAAHYGKGAAKYERVNGRDNWRNGYEWSLSYAAMQRHLTAFWSGEDNDPETGSPHLVAVAWHCFTLLDFMQHYPEFDDRQDPLYARDSECNCYGIAADGTRLVHVGDPHITKGRPEREHTGTASPHIDVDGSAWDHCACAECRANA